MNHNYLVAENETRLKRRLRLLGILKIYVAKISTLTRKELLDFEFFALEWMENERTYHDADCYECDLEPSPSDVEIVKHFCHFLLEFMACERDIEKTPCSSCIESISMFLGHIILQYEKRRFSHEI